MGVDWTRLNANDMVGARCMESGSVLGLIGSGCMIWQEPWYGRWLCVGVDWIGLYDIAVACCMVGVRVWGVDWIWLYDMEGARGMAGGHVWGLIASGCMG